MTIRFDEKPIYRKIRTGDVEQIISHNIQNNQTIVRSSDGKEKILNIVLDCHYLSFSPTDFKEIDYECIKYVIERGVRRLLRIPERYYELIHNTEEQMKELIELLQKINSGELEVKTHKIHECDVIINDGSIVNKIEDLIIFALSSYTGDYHLGNIDKLRKLGFDVFPKDNGNVCGWISGCIKTEKGIILYG